MGSENNKRKLKPFFATSILCVCCTLLLTACNQPVAQRVINGSSNVGVSTGVAIIYPFDGSQFQVGEFVDVHSRISDPAGAIASSLTANSELLRRDLFVSPVVDGNLYQPWIPSEPGTYILQVILETAGGSQIISGLVTVYVGESAAEKNPETVITNTPDITDTPTLTFTPTLTNTPTVTNTPKPSTVTNTPKSSTITNTPKPEGPSYSACHDYPDLATCLSDPNGFGGCTWDTGMNKCQP